MKRWWQKQRVWKPCGWWIMYSWGQSCGLAFILCGWHRTAIRVNGGEIIIGPISISIQPPAPQWMLDDTAEPAPMRCPWCQEFHSGGPEWCGDPSAQPTQAQS
jgi:hypothetical protein